MEKTVSDLIEYHSLEYEVIIFDTNTDVITESDCDGDCGLFGDDCPLVSEG